MNIAIIALGIGNIASVRNMIRRIGYEARFVETPSEARDADWLILPGVGAFDHGMERVDKAGWRDYLTGPFASTSGRLMGICLGMQLLCDGSDEGKLPGLGLVPGYFRRFEPEAHDGERIKVPHMGWNQVRFDPEKASWTIDLPENPRFYFVHSYRYTHSSHDHSIGVATYGSEFVAAIQNGKTIGFQFHPEKSHRFGQSLLRLALES